MKTVLHLICLSFGLCCLTAQAEMPSQITIFNSTQQKLNIYSPTTTKCIIPESATTKQQTPKATFLIDNKSYMACQMWLCGSGRNQDACKTQPGNSDCTFSINSKGVTVNPMPKCIYTVNIEQTPCQTNSTSPCYTATITK